MSHINHSRKDSGGVSGDRIRARASADANCNSHSSATTVSPSTSPSSAGASSVGGSGSTSSCGSCIQLVGEILQREGSRPRQILQALMRLDLNEGGSTSSGTDATTNNNRIMTIARVNDSSLQVEIPMPSPHHPVPPRRWTRVAMETASASPALAEQQDDNPKEVPLYSTLDALLPRIHIPRPPVPLATSSNTASSTPTKTEVLQIHCRPCANTGAEANARALIMGPTPLSIVACTNRLTPNDRHELEEILTHELIHAYDVKRLHLDFTDCESMAYSEVRAAREAECFSSWRSNFAFLKEYCVKQKAIAATHNLFPHQGRQCVRTVFSAAMKDERPGNGHVENDTIATNNSNQNIQNNPNPTRVVQGTASHR